jgi:hypothetical protein
MRRIVSAAYLGEKPGDPSALENPASVDENQARSEVTRDNPVREGLDGRQDCLHHVRVGKHS